MKRILLVLLVLSTLAKAQTSTAIDKKKLDLIQDSNHGLNDYCSICFLPSENEGLSGVVWIKITKQGKWFTNYPYTVRIDNKNNYIYIFNKGRIELAYRINRWKDKPKCTDCKLI